MSKTIRRKKTKPPHWVTHKHKRIAVRVKGDYILWQWAWVPLDPEEQKKEIAKYYSDNGFGDYWPVPSWYPKMLNRKFRSRSKNEMKKLNSWKEWDDYEFEPKVNCKGYYW